MLRYREVTSLLTPGLKGAGVVALLVVIYFVLTTLHTLRDTILVIVSALVLLLIWFSFNRMKILVDRETIHIIYGSLGLLRKKIALSDIEEAREIIFKPLQQFGGWGCRLGNIEGVPTGCLTMRGNVGILLKMRREVKICIKPTKSLVLGTAHPETLLHVIHNRNQTVS